MKLSRRAKRMHRNHKRSKRGSGLMLVSLMDIFTILVFFLLVNTTEQVDPYPAIADMPESSTQVRAKEGILLDATLTDISLNNTVIISDLKAWLAEPLIVTMNPKMLEQALATAAENSETPDAVTQAKAEYEQTLAEAKIKAPLQIKLIEALTLARKAELAKQAAKSTSNPQVNIAAPSDATQPPAGGSITTAQEPTIKEPKLTLRGNKNLTFKSINKLNRAALAAGYKSIWHAANQAVTARDLIVAPIQPASTAPTNTAPTSTAPTSTAPTNTAPTSAAPTTAPSSAVPSTTESITNESASEPANASTGGAN